jgi:hypothetical protein
MFLPCEIDLYFTLSCMLLQSGNPNTWKKLGMSTLCAHFRVLPVGRCFFFTLTYMMPLRGISNSPEEQGVSTTVRTSQFFPCEDVFSSHYSPIYVTTR